MVQENDIRLPFYVRGPGVPKGVKLPHLVGNVSGQEGWWRTLCPPGWHWLAQYPTIRPTGWTPPTPCPALPFLSFLTPSAG